MLATPVVDAPIGVFDSGIGGLSVLGALRAELPQEDFVYVADSGHAPYGERDEAHVIARSRAILRHLRERHGIKALVIACNTATAAAVRLLRQEHPGFTIVGIEPALKPAVASSQTRRIGVMATRGTLASVKFHALLDSLAGQADFVIQPCAGLADAIEQESRSGNATKTIALCEQYTGAMGDFGQEDRQIDTLVLGCTHYPFAADHLRARVGPAVHFIEPGAPVARHTRRRLDAAGLLRPADVPRGGRIELQATGQPDALQAAARRWLNLDVPVRALPENQ